MTPIGALIGGWLFNYTSRTNKYRANFLVSVFCIGLGDLFYYLAETVNQKHSSTVGVIFIVIGRVLIGFGGARLMIRKFMAINIEIWAMSKYSAIFVGISAFG